MFRIFRIDSGWIMGEIKDASGTLFFDYSWITNFLDDFMKALLCVHGDWEQDECAEQFRGDWEPAVDRWHFGLEEGRLYIHIDRYEDEKVEEVREKFDLEFDYYEFLKEFVDAMKDVLNKHGLLGYRKAWGAEFPIGLFLKIVDISQESNKINYYLISAENNVGLETLATEFDSEMEVLAGVQENYGNKI